MSLSCCLHIVVEHRNHISSLFMVFDETFAELKWLQESFVKLGFHLVMFFFYLYR